MDPTTLSIFLTQIPIAVGILIGAYEVHKARKDFIRILEKLAKK